MASIPRNIFKPQRFVKTGVQVGRGKISYSREREERYALS